jgi:MFS family permease
VPYFRRSTLLGWGNVILGVFTVVTGLSQNFFQLTASRVLGGIGASAQNPVGAAMLVGYFPNARGRVLTLHHTAGSLGSLIAPAIIAGLILITDWRTVFFLLAIPSILMGLSYFFLRDMVTVSSASKKSRGRATLDDYRACLRNRNVILVSLIQMVGAAGRGTGINSAFLTGFFIVALGADIPTAAALLIVLEVGGLFGPLAIGWLSDRVGRKPVILLTLFLSTLTTLWLLTHHGVTPWLALNLVAYGSVVSARGSMTQAMVSDAVPLTHTDTAFSIYFFIGFLAGPAWTFLMGWIIDAHSFANAFAVVSVSYLFGMLLVGFTRFTREPPPAASAPA